MAHIHLIRHGRASASYDVDRNPGLDEQGHLEAQTAAEAFSADRPLPLWSSPLLRCRETSVPFEALWGVSAQVEPAVAEVASPTDDLAERGEWLRQAMASQWSALEQEPQAWRAELLAKLATIETETVIVTHFMVINAVLGAAQGADDVLVARPQNGSSTLVNVTPTGFELVELGSTGRSEVL